MSIQANRQPDYMSSFEGISRQRPQAVAIRDDYSEVTFAELHYSVRLVAAGIRDLGVRPSDIVTVAMTPSAPYLAVLLGILAAGATVAPLNTRLSAAESIGYRSVLKPVVGISDRRHHDVGDTVVLDHLAKAAPLAERLAPLAGTAIAEGVFYPRTNNPAMVLPTGGTTGTPKAVVLSHRSMWLQAHQSALDWKRLYGDVELWFAPLYHLGVVVCPLATLIAGATVRLMERFDPERVLKEICDGGVTHLSGPFTVHRLLWNHPQFSPRRTGRVRQVMIGGSAATPEVLTRLVESYPSARITHGYATTETGSVTKMIQEHLDAGRRTGVGHPVPSVSVEIVDPEGQPVPVGEEGSVRIATPWEADGYLHNRSETATTFGPHGIQVGDIGVLDEDGWLTLLGRHSDMVKTGGENVFPSEVEQVLDRHSAVDGVVAYGVPDETWGERIEAAVVLRSGGVVDPGELREFARAHWADYKVPKVIRFLES